MSDPGAALTSLDTERADAVARALAGVRRIAMLPDVTLRIVDIASDRRSSATELHRVVSTDPMLCIRVLKVVNSAFYGLAQPVASIERAVLLLGAEAVRNIALAASLGRLAADGDGRSDAAARALWGHSLAVAAAAQRLAEAAGAAGAGEAFLAGLLHDIGFIVQLKHDHRALDDALQRAAAGEASLLELEERAFGANHQDFGQGLCRQWQLPPCVTEVLWRHHDPLALDTAARELACLVHVADALACACGLGFSGHPDHAPDAAGAAAVLGLDDDELQRIGDALPATTASLQRLLQA